MVWWRRPATVIGIGALGLLTLAALLYAISLVLEPSPTLGARRPAPPAPPVPTTVGYVLDHPLVQAYGQ